MMALAFGLVLTIILSFGPIGFALKVWSLNSFRVKNGKQIRKKLKGRDRVFAYMPVLNLCISRKAYYGTYGFVFPVAVVSIIMVTLRFLLTCIPPIAIAAMNNTFLGNLQIFSLPLCYLGIFVIHVLSCIVYIDIMRMYRFSIPYYIFVVIMPCIAALFLQSSIYRQVKEDSEITSNRFEGA